MSVIYIKRYNFNPPKKNLYDADIVLEITSDNRLKIIKDRYNNFDNTVFVQNFGTLHGMKIITDNPIEFLKNKGFVIKKKPKTGTIDSTYLHIGNGGVEFKITNDEKFGPTLKITSSHFGNNIHEQMIHVDKESLFELKCLFENASNFDYGNKEYCHKATLVK